MKKQKLPLPKSKHDANYIDKIIKENCASLVPFIFSKMLNLQFDKMENLSAIRQQATLEKEPDFLRLIYNKDYPKGAVVQLEFESGDDLKMDRRMLLYLALEYQRRGLPVLQYVIFLNKGQAKMNYRLQFGQMDYAFTVLNIEDFSYREFIVSNIPEEVILSLLANPEDLAIDDLLEMIIRRLFELKGDSIATRKFINQLIMLSRFRNLHEQTVQKVKDMGFTTFDVNTDLLYLEGVEVGIARGLEQGLEQGLEKGELKKAIAAIQIMTEDKVDKKLIARFLKVEMTFVNKIQKQLLKRDKITALLETKNADAQKISEKLKVHPLLVTVIEEELKEKKKK